MVSENEDCHRKSKLTITVKTLNKYNDSQAAKQTKKKNSEAQTKHTNK